MVVNSLYCFDMWSRETYDTIRGAVSLQMGSKRNSVCVVIGDSIESTALYEPLAVVDAVMCDFVMSIQVQASPFP